MLGDKYLDTVSRGLLWACGKLTDDGAAMEGYDGIGKAKILLPYMMKDLVPGPVPTPAKRKP